MDNNKKTPLSDIIKHLGVKNITVAVFIMIFFAAMIVAYNSMLYTSLKNRIIRDGELRAVKSAERFEIYLSSGNDALKLSDYTLQGIIDDGGDSEALLAYLGEQTDNIKTTLLKNTTGLYAYIDGKYYDSEWVPGPDFEPTKRPWYIGAQAHKGAITVIDPYLDLQTGDMTLTLVKTMKNTDNVIALDITMDEIQTITEESSEKGLIEMMLDSKGKVVAHSDRNELGKDYMAESGSVSAAVAQRLYTTDDHYFEIAFGAQKYMVYAVPLGNMWHSVTVIDATESFLTLNVLLIASIFAIIVTLVILAVILLSAGRKEIIAERLSTQLASSANIYMALFDIDLINRSVRQIKNSSPDFVRKLGAHELDVQEVFNRAMKNIPESTTKEAAIRFVDLSTLEERLADTNTVTIEYLSYNSLWCRGRFTVSERTSDGKLSHVLWMLENIDEEKRERDNLTKKAEKLNIQLTSAANIYISLCDLDIPKNDVTPIINKNPAIAQIVNSCNHNMQQLFFGIMNGLPNSPTKQAAIDFADMTDINERMKDTNTVTLEYLSYGNLWVRARYVVSERDEKGKITHVLWMLENIDAEKRERDKLISETQKLAVQLSSAADIYLTLCDIDVLNNSFSAIRNNNPAVEHLVDEYSHDTQAGFDEIMYGLPESDTKKSAIDFTDLSTLDERMKDTNTITLEYLSYGNIWVRARFVVSERTPEGRVSHALWMIENIDTEKRARDKLIAEAEKLTRQLASAADIYIALLDLDVINDRFTVIRSEEQLVYEMVEKHGTDNMQDAFSDGVTRLPESTMKQAVKDFYDFSKINELLSDKNSAALEYMSFGDIWARGRYIVSDRLPDGRISHVLWVLENIDEEKRERDKLLKESEKLYMQLTSAADIYIALCDIDIVRDSVTEIKNADPVLSMIIGKCSNNMSEIFHGIMSGLPESPTKKAAIEFTDLSTLRERLSDTNTITLEYLGLGDEWVRGRFVASEYDENGIVTHVLWMLENIDKEKRARDKLYALAEKLNMQMSSIANVYMSVYDFDLENDSFSEVKTSVIQHVTDIIGSNKLDAQSTLYAVMNQMTDAEFIDKVFEFIDLSTIEERLGDLKTIALEYLSSDKKWRRGRFIASERTESGKLTHVLWLVEDIDQEKKDREKLIDMSERAIAANEAKSTFLSNMSHEIRTPINAVLGMNEMVLRESTEPNILTYSESIRNAGTTLLSIINDILDFSKIEAGKMEIIPVEYDLASALNDLVNMVQTRAEAKDLIVIPDFDKSTPHLLYGDEVRIKQVITNILTNAVKYTEKGSVTFSVKYHDIENDPDSIMLIVAVKDTGIGIRKEDMEKLFSEFERLEQKRNRTIEGTGLGMSITQSLLSMMGSHISVESVYGEGSLFSFELKQKVVSREPLGDYAAAYSKAIATRKKYTEKFTAPDAHVLVVDDTAMNLLVFKGLLKKTEVQIDTAASGVEGIALAAKNKYDIIFLDHMMPGKDGIETLHDIKADGQGLNSRTPTVCLTANAIAGAREKYLEAGFDDYLTKPIESAKLEEMLGSYLPDELIKPASSGEAPKEVPQETSGAETADDPAELPAAIYDLPELDTAEGLRLTGSGTVYLSALRTFAETAYDLTVAAENCWISGDTAQMTRKIHILGSAAQIIGAKWIMLAAQRLEAAGIENDKYTVNEGIEELMFRCRALAAKLWSAVGNED